MLTDDDLRVIWSAGPEPDDGESGPRWLAELLPPDDDETVSRLRRALTERDHASVTAPSGRTYHVIDGRGDLEENGLLWYWQTVPADARRAADERAADERAARLEHVVNRFLLDLRMLGFGIPGSTSRRLPGVDTLSPRERSVVDALVRGGRTVTIARELDVSQSTVRSHLSAAFRKLGVSSQAELMERLGTGTVDLRDSVVSVGVGDVDAEGEGLGEDREPGLVQPGPAAQDEPV